MSVKDLFHEEVPKVAVKLQEITTDTTTVGEEIDRAGFKSVTFNQQTGTITDGDYAVLLEEADDDGTGSPGTFAAVADADLIGTEALASFTADTDDDKTSKLGYRGTKRWLRESIVSTNTTSGGFIASQVILSHPDHAAKSDQTP